MNKKEKAEKKEIIGRSVEHIYSNLGFKDLGNGRFKDDEVNSLYNLVQNIGEYNGKSYSSRSQSTGWCSDGKYTRDMTTTTGIVSDEDGIRVEVRRDYHDDDGTSGSFTNTFKTAREILGFMGFLF